MSALFIDVLIGGAGGAGGGAAGSGSVTLPGSRLIELLNEVFLTMDEMTASAGVLKVSRATHKERSDEDVEPTNVAASLSLLSPPHPCSLFLPVLLRLRRGASNMLWPRVSPPPNRTTLSGSPGWPCASQARREGLLLSFFSSPLFFVCLVATRQILQPGAPHTYFPSPRPFPRARRRWLTSQPPMAYPCACAWASTLAAAWAGSSGGPPRGSASWGTWSSALLLPAAASSRSSRLPLLFYAVDSFFLFRSLAPQMPTHYSRAPLPQHDVTNGLHLRARSNSGSDPLPLVTLACFF